MIKEANILPALVSKLVQLVSSKTITNTIAGTAVVNWIQDRLTQKAQETESKITEEERGDPVRDTLYAFSNLANTLKSMGATDPRWTDGEQLRSYFESQGYSASAKQLAPLVDSIRMFLNDANSLNLVSYDPNIVNDTLNFTFDFLRNNRYNVKATQQKLEELRKKTSEPYGPAQVIAVLKKNYLLASVLTLMVNLGKPKEALEELLPMAQEAQIMLGNASTELLDYQALHDQKLRTEVDKLNKSIDQFKLMTPVAMHKERVIGDFYNRLSSYFGSDFAKAIVSTPIIQTGYTVTYFIRDGLSGFRSGSSEALRSGKV